MPTSPAVPETRQPLLGPEMGPARCPDCGERQNVAVGEFDPNREPFGLVHCMVCGHTFTRREFQAGLSRAERRSDR